MQIPSVPPPIMPNNLAQDVVAKTIPPVQTVLPASQNAVGAPPKSEKNRNLRDKKSGRDRGNSRDRDPKDDLSGDGRGGSVNISV